MATTPEADFTPHDVNLRLKRGNYTPVIFTFTGVNFTGYTVPILLWAINQNDTASTVSAAFTDAVNGELTVIFDAAQWTALGSATGATFHVECLNPSSKRDILVTGELAIEWTLA